MKYPRFPISSIFLKFNCQPQYLFWNMSFGDSFFTFIGFNEYNYDFFNFSFFGWFLLLLVISLTVFVTKSETMGKAFQEQGFVYVTQMFGSCSYLLNTSDLVMACASEVDFSWRDHRRYFYGEQRLKETVADISFNHLFCLFYFLTFTTLN